VPTARPERAVRTFTGVGALLFFGALGYFLYCYFVDFAAPTVDGPSAGPVAWDVGLFTLFAAHHSVFARSPLRAWLARYAPPPLERSIYVWVASALFVAVCALWKPVPGVAWDVHGPWRLALAALQIAGVVLTLVGAAALDVRELAGLTTQSSPPHDSSPTVFKTTGPYGWIRHPIYAGWFLMVLPATPMTMTRLVFAAVSCAYLVMAIPWEERTLRGASAASYDAYVRKVRWRLLPGIY
jgi:methanethiol S-methyltransferase